MRHGGVIAASKAATAAAAAHHVPFRVPFVTTRCHHGGTCGCRGLTPLSSSSGDAFTSARRQRGVDVADAGAVVGISTGSPLTLPAAPRVGGRRHTCTATVAVQQRQCSSSSSGGTFADGGRPYVAGQTVQEKYPIVQLPARSLWCRQYALDPHRVQQGEYEHLIAQVKAARHYYQYPSLSAPQNGWNVQMFALFDDTVFINPVNLDEEAWRAEATQKGVPWIAFEEEKMRELRAEGKTGFAWEPCASSGFMLHYIERPLTVRIRALDEHGKTFTTTLDRMRGRMALHELDHLNGILFTRRVVDTDHVVPMEGFVTMSDWSDDYPSLEARSTFLYTIFTPPYHFVTDAVEDGNLLDRKFEDGIYPGCEQDRQQRIESAALEELQRTAWRTEKKKQQETTQPAGTHVEPHEAAASHESL